MNLDFQSTLQIIMIRRQQVVDDSTVIGGFKFTVNLNRDTQQQMGVHSEPRQKIKACRQQLRGGR